VGGCGPILRNFGDYWFKKAKVGGGVRQYLGHGRPLLPSEGSNLSTSLFTKEIFRMKYGGRGVPK